MNNQPEFGVGQAVIVEHRNKLFRGTVVEVSIIEKLEHISIKKERFEVPMRILTYTVGLNDRVEPPAYIPKKVVVYNTILDFEYEECKLADAKRDERIGIIGKMIEEFNSLPDPQSPKED